MKVTEKECYVERKLYVSDLGWVNVKWEENDG